MVRGAAEGPDGGASASTIKTVVLELALNPGAPGAPRGRSQGYVLTAPLSEAGYLQTSELGAQRWPVRRFGDVGDGDTGWLAHRGKAWFIDYDEESDSDDEPIFRLTDHRFVIGEYITITNDEGTALTYRVASVDSVD